MFIKKSSVDELASNLKALMPVSKSAVIHLVEAANLLDTVGLEKYAEEVTSIVEAWHVPTQHSPSSEQMISNLKDHGTVLEKPKGDFVPNSALHGEKATLVPYINLQNKNDANDAKDGEILEVEDPDHDGDAWKHEKDEKNPGHSE